MKKILSLILLFISVWTAKADDANWKIHPIFDEEVTHVVDTPDYVYFTSQKIMTSTSVKDVYLSLFRFDKKGDELLPLSTSNYLNGYDIRDIIYNPEKGYVAILYKDYNIDLLYNNGKVVFIPYYEQASLSYSKNVNGIALDPANNRLYFATDFGYVAINDEKGEVAESRIYGEPFTSFCRLGDFYLALADNKLVQAPVASPRLSLSDYKEIDSFSNPQALYPVSDEICVLISGPVNNSEVKKIIRNGNDFKIENLFKGLIYNVDYTSNGVVFAMKDALNLVNPDGSVTSIDRHPEYSATAASSHNMSEVWNGCKRKGLSSVKKTGDQWSLTRDWMLPNAPATYATTSFNVHPDKGLLLLDYGYMPQTYGLYSYSPLQLTAYKSGRFTNLAPAYTNPERASIITASNGLVIDPDNRQYVYITSFHNGILRLNVNDPRDIIHMSRSNDPGAKNEGFVELNVPNTNKGFSNISAPYFDKQGNMWMYMANWDISQDPKPNFYCWLAADRKATSSASDVKLPEWVMFDVNFPVSNTGLGVPLLKTGNGLIVCAVGNYDEAIVMIDTNGTPVDTSDDKYYPFPYFSDSDGNALELNYVKHIWEDPSTGYVWICHGNGVCYFVPSQVLQGNYQLHRVKVARNDGTNLADYLLEGVTVNHLVADAEGRKWFSTGGGGVVCTSSDGREIVEEFNTSNSPLPADVVYGIGYNPENNALMISTEEGYAEYYLPLSQSSSTKADIRAYPNPVRPDFSGYVTITDIPHGSFVKIVDAAGNLVKELGIVSGFDILWDVSDSNFNRVKSGVYHIMVSPSDESSSYSTVGKILVMN